jgi:single-strand DNA-binding protein
MINQCILVGNVTKDFELKEVNDSKIANFRIAVNDRRDDNNTLFITVTAFNKVAELASEYLSKGDKVGVVGRLQIRNKDDKQYTEVVAEKIEFLTPKNVKPDDFME